MTSKPPAALVGLGRVALSQAELDDAQAFFRQALAAPGRSASTTAEALVYAAEGLARHGDPAKAVEVAAFLSSWLGAPHGVKLTARSLLNAIEFRLPPEKRTTAQEQGRRRQLEEIVALAVTS